MQKMVVSNIRFPQDEWAMLKAAASMHEMSINEYMRYLTQADAIRSATGIKIVKVKKGGYDGMDRFLNRKIVGKPMGMSDEDEAIYGL